MTEKEAEVYIFLAKHDALKGTEIAKLLGKDKAQIFHILKKLQAKGFAESTIDFPAHFTAVPFENVLDSITKARREEVAFIEKSKNELLDYMRRKRKFESEPSLEKFVVIKGNKRIYARISKMILDTKHQLFAATTVPGLMRADQFGIFDVAFNHPLRAQIQYRFLTELSEQNLNAMKAVLKRAPKTDFNLKARNPDLGLNLFPRMITRDNEEILFFITPRTDRREKDDVCLWTNCKSLIQAFTAVFEDFWNSSTDVQDKIAEIEMGRPTPKTCVFSDAEVAKKWYEETMQSAKEEIILMTSSKGLIAYWRSRLHLREWAGKGVCVKIMAPIVSENLEAAEQLSKFCSVRHVPINYLETTIVDGKRLFQFKMTPQAQEKFGTTTHFENTFYTDNLEYVEKMKTMLNDMWKSARAPSTVTLGSILRRFHESNVPSPPDRPFPGGTHLRKLRGWNVKDRKQSRITEKDVLSKIMTAKKHPARMPSKALGRGYGSAAAAVIHPPTHFNLPDMLINVFHYEKQTLPTGEEDVLWISLWLETPEGHAYVPVAAVGDNPNQTLWKAALAGTPAAQNVQLVKKDQLQIRIHGSSLFAGWTVRIPLFPPQYILPPACLLIEAYGDVKTEIHTTIPPSGYRIETEENSFNAFVTFFHPTSKYSGPGTDGYFGRDFVSTVYPPSTKNQQ